MPRELFENQSAADVINQGPDYSAAWTSAERSAYSAERSAYDAAYKAIFHVADIAIRDTINGVDGSTLS